MDPFTPLAFGQRLKSLIGLSGMSQIEFAARAKVCPTTISKYVRGHALPDWLRVCLFADVLGVPTDALRADQVMAWK